MPIEGVIFDVDGVLVDSPHERAWRESLQALMASDWQRLASASDYRPERFTSGVYQALVAGKPRLSGARAALEYFRVPDAERRARQYAERKQRRLEELIEAGEFAPYPDGLRFLLALRGRGLRLAAASSSRNANRLMERIRLDAFAREAGLPEPAVPDGLTLLQAFDANVCGRVVPRGKPHPDLFLLAARELGLPPRRCLVVEDAPAGIQAARAAQMAALGVARRGDEALLAAAGADLVVSSLDEVSLEALAEGRLKRVDPTRRR